jgi:hypothetical protein
MTLTTAPRTRSSLRCQVLRWHRWRTHSTDDGSRYASCARCGCDWYGTSSTNTGGFAAGAFLPGI